MLQTMKILEAKAAVEKRVGKARKIPAWQTEKVKSKKDVILEAQRDKKRVHFASLKDILSFQESRVGTKAPKIQRTSRAPRRHSKI